MCSISLLAKEELDEKFDEMRTHYQGGWKNQRETSSLLKANTKSFRTHICHRTTVLIEPDIQCQCFCSLATTKSANFSFRF